MFFFFFWDLTWCATSSVWWVASVQIMDSCKVEEITTHPLRLIFFQEINAHFHCFGWRFSFKWTKISSCLLMLTDTTHTGLSISVFLHLIATTSHKSEYHLNNYTCGVQRVSSPHACWHSGGAAHKPPTSGRCAPLPTHHPASIPMRLYSTHHWYVQAGVHMGDNTHNPKGNFHRNSPPEGLSHFHARPKAIKMQMSMLSFTHIIISTHEVHFMPLLTW